MGEEMSLFHINIIRSSNLNAQILKNTSCKINNKNSR